MDKEQMNKYAYELMIKNNPDEAVKNLLLKDKKIKKLNNIICELEKWLEENDKQLCLRKLRELEEGKENEKDIQKD